MKRNFLLPAIVFLAPLCFYSHQSNALSNAELTEKVEALEQQAAEYKKKIKKLEKNSKRNKKGIRKAERALDKVSDRVRLNGFMSIGMGTLSKGNSDDDIILNGGLNDSANTTADSAIGIQMQFKISDRSRVSVQTLSKGSNYHKPITEWAFISYDVSKALTIKGGRLRSPYYRLSEFLEVGFAYPWVRPPISLYNLPLQNYEGFDFNYKFKIGATSMLAWAYLGRAITIDSEFAQIELELDSYNGFGLSAEYGNWEVRLGYNYCSCSGTPIPGSTTDLFLSTLNGEAELLPGTGVTLPDLAMIVNSTGGNVLTDYSVNSTDILGSYAPFSIHYDNGSLFVSFEVALLVASFDLFPAGETGYIAAGYRFGKWTPYATIGTYYTNLRNERGRNLKADNIDAMIATLITTIPEVSDLSQLSDGLRSLNLQQDEYILGIGYAVSPRIKAKLEISHYEDFGGTNGLLQGTKSPGKNIQAYSFVIDTVF